MNSNLSKDDISKALMTFCRELIKMSRSEEEKSVCAKIVHPSETSRFYDMQLWIASIAELTLPALSAWSASKMEITKDIESCSKKLEEDAAIVETLKPGQKKGFALNTPGKSKKWRFLLKNQSLVDNFFLSCFISFLTIKSQIQAKQKSLKWDLLIF